MTIWWSKATRLLEFSRSYLGSLYQRYAGNNGTRQPGFFVTEELGILVIGFCEGVCQKRIWGIRPQRRCSTPFTELIFIPTKFVDLEVPSRRPIFNRFGVCPPPPVTDGFHKKRVWLQCNLRTLNWNAFHGIVWTKLEKWKWLHCSDWISYVWSTWLDSVKNWSRPNGEVVASSSRL